MIIRFYRIELIIEVKKIFTPAVTSYSPAGYIIFKQLNAIFVLSVLW
jgi:hypothetical protein